MALSNSQYEAIIKGYERVRDANRELGESRREEIYNSIPGFRELEDSVSTLSAACARRMLEGDESALNGLHDKLKEIACTQKLLLKEHGFPPDYLEPVYHCASCRDTGYVTSPEGLKEKCTCFKQQEISLLYAIR